MSAQIKFDAAGQTDVGQVRASNQDSYIVDDRNGLFIVADGMGGHAGGEIASQLAIECISSHLQQNLNAALKATVELPHPRGKLQRTLANAVNYASAKIYERALEEPQLRGMGTTATVLKIVDDYAYFAHVGDSRLYLLRQGFIFQMTYDHSLVSEQLRAGVLTKEEAEFHHLRNVITRSVGYQEEEDVDSGAFRLEDQDRLLLCSDGLHGKVHNKELAKFLKDQGIRSVSNLIALANQRGGEDNITAITVQVQVLPKSTAKE